MKLIKKIAEKLIKKKEIEPFKREYYIRNLFISKTHGHGNIQKMIYMLMILLIRKDIIKYQLLLK